MESSGTEKVYLQNDLGVVTKDLAENIQEQIFNRAQHLVKSLPHTQRMKTVSFQITIINNFLFSFSITAVPQDPEDTEQCERASHLVLADVFVPVSEETGDDSSQDSTMAVELKLHSKEASTVSLPERRDTPYEELTQVLFVF